MENQKILELVKNTTNLNLLYVEDNLDVRESTLKVLNKFFTNIVVAIDGEDGIAKFRDNDIIISDINMPKMDGITLLKHIRDEDKDVPFILLSAHNDSEYFQNAIEEGVDAFISKPLTLNQFVQSIGKAVEKLLLKHDLEAYYNTLEATVEDRTRELQFKIEFDELTGLKSRHSFFKDLDTLKLPIVFIVDIDRFKHINEIYGQEFGSLVLQKFASLLKKLIKDTTYKAYRLSGDEFAIIDFVDSIDNEKYERGIKKFNKELLELKISYNEDISININATIGISIAQDEPYETANVALEYAKNNKQDYAFFSHEIDTRKDSTEILECRDIITNAIKDERVVSVYQPIVDKDGNISKYETLMRIEQKDTDDLLSPFYFLDIAIRTRLYNQLSFTIIFQALDKISKTLDSVSINFTYDDITNSNLLHQIKQYIKKYPNLGERIVFEITENESFENYDEVKKFIKSFKKLGVRIAIDDFGSGFSNFEYILELEPDFLKIDGSLIKNIDKDHRAYALVEAIISFSHKLGIKVIAEFVHSKEVFELLKALDVDEFQGFYFYEPQKDFT